MTSEAPIPLSRGMIKAVQDWAADDRLWSTKETTEFNLYTFARLVLKLEGPAGGARGCNQAEQGTPQSTGTFQVEASAPS